MKKNSLLLVFTMLPLFFISAQQNQETYPFAKDVKARIEKDTVAWKYQTGAVNYSFIGDYKNTLTVWDQGAPPRIYTPTHADSAILKNASIQNAKDYIVHRSKSEQIVIINEAHHHPEHRTFTRSLLEGLYQNGYRYLGLEAIFDTAVNVRNYAVKESGFYTVEPEFGNLIYEARRIGFILFSYEASIGKNGKEREIEQARNIEKFMHSNPDGKYLIHCGFDHAFEKKMRNWEKAMAGRLKEYTNIDPLTIDQVRFSEKSKPEFSHYFSYATEATRSFVLINPDNQVFNGISEPRQTDIVVIHPITQYENERPTWLAFDRSVYRIPEIIQKKYNYPLQLLAYRSSEYENDGIPADIVELQNRQDQKPLYLQKGKYQIVVRNERYVVCDVFEVLIE